MGFIRVTLAAPWCRRVVSGRLWETSGFRLEFVRDCDLSFLSLDWNCEC